MNIKGIIVFILISIIIFIIYIFNVDKKIYYFNITDKKITYNQFIVEKLNKNLENYINYMDKDIRITDLINDIHNNKEFFIKRKKYTIQNILIKADILTIKVGSNELKYKSSTSNIYDLYNYIDEYLEDLESLFVLLKKYDKEKIIYINELINSGSYKDEVFNYLNLKIKDLCYDYNIEYVELNEHIEEKLLKYLHLTI